MKIFRSIVLEQKQHLPNGCIIILDRGHVLEASWLVNLFDHSGMLIGHSSKMNKIAVVNNPGFYVVTLANKRYASDYIYVAGVRNNVIELFGA
jgi:hypothetical protein